ncbi:hypothetical protein B0A55_01327 [Friedmanniomyces simplex]|uniref:HIT domain-containing protein n=1 Tax=Friedmanniomyces simplex TaxID=329884 RepID=A0A4U0Y1H9_9PEZI|nr:hypothetical protein B0A55_01327 [Friedmanniomyces simplex]
MAHATAANAHVSSRKHNVEVTGLYGIPGSGKATLLRQLSGHLDNTKFDFYDGSNAIRKLVPGGLGAFKNLPIQEQMTHRERAITQIRDECEASGKIGVVAGHLIFWDDAAKWGPTPVYRETDLETYTHILYLDVGADIIAQRRRDDPERQRPDLSPEHLRLWQSRETLYLRRLCSLDCFHFSLLSTYGMDRVVSLLQEFPNTSIAEAILDKAVAGHHSLLETMPVFDADKTLADADSSDEYWDSNESLNSTFKRMGYTYPAFYQAASLYEHHKNETEFQIVCDSIVEEITLRDEMLNLLTLAAKQWHVGAVVVTCGLRQVREKVLEKVLEKAHLSVPVIGNGRLSNGYIVTPEVKADLVARLKHHHGLRVIAFGDSPIDLPMWKRADQAIVVVGDEKKRSKRMEQDLSVVPRLVGLIEQPPEIVPWRSDFIDSIIKRRLPIFHATDRKGAKLLQTPMRDASVSGPALREAHRRVGYYLATEFLTDLIGLEGCSIRHVQGGVTQGHRLLDEQNTTIVPLLRGGEPLAFGVSEAFPLAMFVHVKKAKHLDAGQLRGQSTVVLVDSVINTGKLIEELTERIRELEPGIRIVVVAGVVQADTVKPDGVLRRLAREGNFSVVALRLSENNYKGQGATDTGDRLFNTTEVFHVTKHSFALVNLKPLLPGHVLVSPLAIKPALADLTKDEVTDLFLTVTRVQQTLRRLYKADAFNIAVQDGVAAGQSVPHVHCHVIPRTIGDPGGDDKVHEWLEGEEGDVGGHQREAESGSSGERKMGQWAKDGERKARTKEEMESEAKWLREEVEKDVSHEGKM